MDETKKILRSLLVSSPSVLTVMKLNNDYREVMGYHIPYKELGYEKLLDFLNAIPDVLTINGNSLNSDVTLIVSEKTAHVNNMVLKQKKGKSHRFNSNRRKIFNGQALCKLTKKVDLEKSTLSKYDNEVAQSDENYKAPNLKPTQSQNHNLKYIKAESTNQNEPSHPESNKTNIEENLSTNISLLPEEQPQSNERLKKKNTTLRRPNFNDESHHTVVSSKNNTDMTKCRKIINNNTPNKDTHYLRRLNYKQNNYNECTKDIPSLMDLKIDIDELKRSDTSDFMHQLLLQKYSSNDLSQGNFQYINGDISTFTSKIKSEIKHIENEKFDCGLKIPSQVQDDLKKLIEDFPEGIWCSQLPDEYKKKFKRELCFEKFGYRCLINMCIDLEHIFQYNKESTCDFKLYDVRKQMPSVETTEVNQMYSVKVPLLEEDAAPSLPLLDWNTYSQLFPKDAVGRDVEISKDFVSQNEVDSDIFRVVVAEIYDPSKFWLFRDDGQLDALMDEMQLFYKTNKERYRIPEQFLEIGLYCAAVSLNEFHRCVIVKMQTDATFVHVFYIDYGSLGTVPKDEVWFLTKDFVRLPAQAIRARLANIYPPIEFAMWTSEARVRFKQLADMKHLKARITNVSKQKKVIEVCIENPIAAPGRTINSILVDEGHALYWNQNRRMNIHDSNCTPRVKFVHLFPDFEEIEYWLAPSIEEMAWFSNTDLTADLYFPQYFSRPIDKNLTDDIEIKAMKLIKKKEEPIKYVDLKDLETIGDMKDILKVSYGDLYEKYKEELRQTMEYCSQYCRRISTSNENINEDHELELNNPDCGDYQKIVSRLRSKFLDSNVPQYTCHGLMNRKSPFSTVKKEETYDEGYIRKKLDDFFEDSSKATIVPSKNNSRIDKLRGQLDKWVDLSELEKYLSQEDPSTSSPTNSNLIYRDTSITGNPNKNLKKNKATDLNGKRSMSKGRRRARNCLLLSYSSSSDEQESRMERPNRYSSRKRSDSSCSDLIKLDVPLECPILTPEIVRISGSKSKTSVVENLSEADDEDDEETCVKLNTLAESKITVLPPKEINNTCSPKVQECTSLRIPNAYCSSSNNGITSLCVSRPACHCQLGHSQIQQWSSGDCSENNQTYYPTAQNIMNNPSNGINFRAEQFFAQSSGVIPIIMFNYNTILPAIGPNAYRSDMRRQNWNRQNYNNAYWNWNR